LLPYADSVQTPGYIDLLAEKILRTVRYDVSSRKSHVADYFR
jgi:hypothetical protein